MTSVTLELWFSMGDEARSVVNDQLLERMPAGFVDPRSVGHRLRSPLPQFIHVETNVLFHVVFGGRGVMGMSDRRFARLTRLGGADADDDEMGLVPVPDLAAAESLRPSRELAIEAALVADEVLPFGVLKNKLQLDESKLSIRGIKSSAMSSLLKALTERSWRAPSEAEWEWACRAHDDQGDDADPPIRPMGRLSGTGLATMGQYAELCRDSWNDTLASTPERGPAGLGHDVLRGRGTGDRFVGWNWSPAWKESLWPGRRRLATWREFIAIRPWVELAR